MSSPRAEFIAKWNALVNEITKGTNIFPETVFTVAIAESSAPNSAGKWIPANNTLSKKANNIFSIKKGTKWSGPTVTHSDDKPNELFRKYSSINESFKDFVKFLQENPRYEKAGVFSAKTPEAQLAALAKAGYASSPSYTTLVLGVLKGIKGYISTSVAAVKNNAGKLFIGGLAAYATYKFLTQK